MTLIGPACIPQPEYVCYSPTPKINIAYSSNGPGRTLYFPAGTILFLDHASTASQFTHIESEFDLITLLIAASWFPIQYAVYVATSALHIRLRLMASTQWAIF